MSKRAMVEQTFDIVAPFATVLSVSSPAMTGVYWELGRRIVEFEQGGSDRASYGEAVIRRLAVDFSARFGRGFSRRNLWQIRAFYLSWPHPETVRVEQVSAGVQTPPLTPAFPLAWSVYVRLLAVKNPDARSFYETEALRSGWSVRQMDRQISSQCYERTRAFAQQRRHAE